MPIVKSDAAHVEIGGLLYIIGGADTHNKSLNTVECYDPSINEWLMLAPMSRKRTSAAACVSFDGFIYVIGGFGVVKCVSSIERYNPRENTWIEVMYLLILCFVIFFIGLEHTFLFADGIHSSFSETVLFCWFPR